MTSRAQNRNWWQLLTAPLGCALLWLSLFFACFFALPTQAATDAGADLAITASLAPNPAIINLLNPQALIYTINVTNLGSDSAANVAVKFDLPDAYFLGAPTCSAPTGTCSVANRTFTYASLSSGTQRTFTLTVFLKTTTLSGTVAYADFAASSSTVDPVTDNNAATVAVTIWKPFDLQVTLRDTPDPVLAGQPITHTLTVTNVGPNQVQRTLDYTFSNPSALAINSGQGSPYPATITASGLTGTLAKATVTLHNLSLAQADSLDVLLVAPNGVSVTLLSDVGGSTALNTLTLGFDDSAAQRLPATALSSGVFRPTNYPDTGSSSDTFPAPGPGVITDTRPSLGWLTGQTGATATGLWKLFVVADDGATGSLAGGWTLRLTMLSDSAQMTLTTVLPSGFVATGTQGGSWSFVRSANLVTATRMSFGAGTVSTINLLATAGYVPGTFTTAATLALINDSQPSNNRAEEATTVQRIHNLAISGAVTPTQLIGGAPLTYTLVVSNLGPSPALAPQVEVTLPGSSTLVAAHSSRGSCNSNGVAIVCALGFWGVTPLSPTVSITISAISPATVGSVSATALITETVDPALGNNQVQLAVELLPSPTPTPSDTSTPTATPLLTDTPIPSPTATSTPTATDTPLITDTPTVTATPLITDAPIATDTPTPTATETSKPTVPPTVDVPSVQSPTPTVTATATDTPAPPNIFLPIVEKG